MAEKFEPFQFQTVADFHNEIIGGCAKLGGGGGILSAMTYPSAPRLTLADPARLEELRAERDKPIVWPPPGFFFRISRGEEEARGDFLKIFGSVSPPAEAPPGEMGFVYENISGGRAVQAAFRIERLEPPRRSVAVAVRAGALAARLCFMEGFVEWGLRGTPPGGAMRLEWRRGRPPPARNLLERGGGSIVGGGFWFRFAETLDGALSAADRKWRRGRR